MVKGYVGVQREKGWKGGMGGPDFMTVEGPGFSLSGPVLLDSDWILTSLSNMLPYAAGRGYL